MYLRIEDNVIQYITGLHFSLRMINKIIIELCVFENTARLRNEIIHYF